MDTQEIDIKKLKIAAKDMLITLAEQGRELYRQYRSAGASHDIAAEKASSEIVRLYHLAIAMSR